MYCLPERRREGGCYSQNIFSSLRTLPACKGGDGVTPCHLCTCGSGDNVSHSLTILSLLSLHNALPPLTTVRLKEKKKREEKAGKAMFFCWKMKKHEVVAAYDMIWKEAPLVTCSSGEEWKKHWAGRRRNIPPHYYLFSVYHTLLSLRRQEKKAISWKEEAEMVWAGGEDSGKPSLLHCCCERRGVPPPPPLPAISPVRNISLSILLYHLLLRHQII